MFLLYTIPINQIPINPPTYRPAGQPAPIILKRQLLKPPFLFSFTFMRAIYILLLLSISFTNSFAQSDEEQIKLILFTQAAAWNEGDIEQYMSAGYWQNDSLLFIGSKGPTYGYTNTLNNYKKSYPTAEKMGELIFSQLSFKRISKDHYFVIGSWKLNRKGGDLSGYFTLLFKKINGQWKIIADHSS